jgi:hypothetical protein
MKWLLAPYRGPLTPPRGALYVSVVVLVIGVVSLEPGAVAFAIGLWFLARWGVKYDERRLRKGPR